MNSSILNIDNEAARANAALARASENRLRLASGALQIVERTDARSSAIALIDAQFNLARDERRRLRRSYKAGRITRTDRDFLFNGQSQLPHVYRSLRILRGRSRELARNNGWFIKFLRMCRRNVIGPNGMRIESQAYTRRGDKLDKPLNALVDEHWKTWSHPENASANRRMSWLDLQLYWMTVLARDGEVLLRKIPDDNAYGFSLRPIDVAWLDETYNDTRNGNRVIMSVEVDSNDRHVAYYLTPPGDAYFPGQPAIRQRTRVLAEDIYFHFIPFDQNASDTVVTRGIPWAHAAMLNLWSLGAFEESAIIAARIGASGMGFLKNRAGDPLTLTKEEMEKNADGHGPADDGDDNTDPDLPTHVDPGMFFDIGDKEFQEFNAKYPSDMVKPFNSAMLHGIAAGLGPEYFSFASDLTEVNFSAGRLGIGEERDNWLAVQGFGGEHLVRPVRLDWQQSSMLTNVLPISPDDLKRLREPKINGRRWGYYDPKVDVQADEKKLGLGLTSRRRILADQSGPDFEEILEDLNNEAQLADEAGIDIAPDKGGAAAAQPQPEEKPKDPNDPNGDAEGD